MALARAMATSALEGVGDPSLGEWHEEGRSAYHIRRRLTPEERALAGNLDVRDIRGSDEERERFATLFREAPQLRQALRQFMSKGT